MTNLMVSGTLNHALPVAMPTPGIRGAHPVENAPSAPVGAGVAVGAR